MGGLLWFVDKRHCLPLPNTHWRLYIASKAAFNNYHAVNRSFYPNSQGGAKKESEGYHHALLFGGGQVSTSAVSDDTVFGFMLFYKLER
jgi:hypothetical protein